MMVVGLLLRFVLVFLLDGNMLLRGDEGIYTELGPKFFSNGFDTGPFVRPPLYFVFLALIHAISGPNSWILVAKLVQCIAGAAVAVPVYRIAFRLAGTRSALFAAGFILFDPTLVAFTHLLWPETIFLLTIAIVFDGLVGLDERSPWRSVGLGTLTGLAMLLKPVFGIFTLLLAAHWVFSKGFVNALKIAVVFGGTAAVVISPWVIRNLQLYGPAIIMENQGPYNLWSGNSPDHPRSILNEWVDIGDQVARSKVGTQRGLEAINEDPARFVRLTLVRALNFWGLEYFVVRHMAIGG
jgi:4-amino-4-deoxy-L-arabinose transferase-like glycosyltransferase